MKTLRQPAAAFAVAWALFAAASAAPLLVPGGAHAAWTEHAAVKTTLVVLAAAAMMLSSGSWSEWGFRRAVAPEWRRSILRGAGLGAATTALLILSPARGMTWIADLGLPGIAAWIWLHSSVTEEIFVRGWFQRFVDSDHRAALSAALFGSMHLMILKHRPDLWTVAIIVAATTALGFLTARDRERTGSLGPPIATHIAFNVGGFVAGVAFAAALFLTTGQNPTL